jgi:hypothetical protein
MSVPQVRDHKFLYRCLLYRNGQAHSIVALDARLQLGHSFLDPKTCVIVFVRKRVSI